VVQAAGCSSNDSARLPGNCDAVFNAIATDAEGTCDGPDGEIHVLRVDCIDDSQMMLAESSGGSDYAWARVGRSWSLLTPRTEDAYRKCTG
jgi:hypothetical protein